MNLNHHPYSTLSLGPTPPSHPAYSTVIREAINKMALHFISRSYQGVHIVVVIIIVTIILLLLLLLLLQLFLLCISHVMVHVDFYVDISLCTT